jgi:hypothetical protein
MYFRLIKESELGAYSWAPHPGLPLAARIRSALPSLWRKLLQAGELHAGTVVEDQGGGRETPLSCGITLFLDDGFVTDYLRGPAPYLSARIYEHVLKGRSPILRVKDVAAANASAQLNLVILHFAIREPPSDDDRGRMILSAAQTGFRLSHLGYRVKRVMAEAYGDEVPFYRAGGFTLKSDYASVFAGRGAPAHHRPHLMGVFDEDAEARIAGTTVSWLFQRSEPRFHFSPAEKRVLSRAVLDESDAEIASALKVSPDAIKKIWLRIHQRVAATASELTEPAALDRRRGKERRRRLLQYLRYHLEEVRPFRRRLPPR